jgi:FHA domain
VLTLAPCPHCATRVPEDGAFCDSCGRALAACPTCGELAKPGEKCVKHGVAVVARPSAAGGGSASGGPPAVGPTVVPPPRRPQPGAPTTTPGVTPNPPPAPRPTVGPAPVKPTHGDTATTVQVLARRLRLVVTSGESLAPLEVDPDTVVGRNEGPFAVLLDPFHDKGLSRRHCQFRKTPTGGWVIVDLAGRGSTRVSADGSFSSPPVAQNASQPLEPGRDQLQLGSLRFRIEPVP